MRRAIIYVRVSTDEQAGGYSLKHQEDRLRQYCQLHNIEIVEIYTEDHSAKTFIRPAFIRLLSFIKKNKKNIDLLLFLKWDRFSRNTSDAYGMISQLNKLGVEPQAIEQPLDLEIPENKIMLAFYLAAPEVENDRRSLNTIAGMRKAMKEGRHCTAAPKGYCNARDNERNPIIIVDEKNEGHIVFAFEAIASEMHSVEKVFKMARRRGFKCSKNQLWRILRNPFYTGRIYIPAYKDEEALTIKGLHKAIISDDLFDRVQDVLDGRKRKYPSFHGIDDELPLRGFLLCGECGRKLTGSASKGNGGRYYYYHCRCGCKERFKASEANEIFAHALIAISIADNVIHLFEEVLKDVSRVSKIDKQSTIQAIQKEIDKNKERLKEAQRMRLDKELDVLEYQEIKLTYEVANKDLLEKQAEVSGLDSNLPTYISHSTDLLRKLPQYYSNADLRGKQLIVGSIFPEKLIFKNKTYRTTKMDDVFALICTTSADLRENKNGTFQFLDEKSHKVPRTGVEPVIPP